MAETTIEYKGVKFDVEYDYQPEEPTTMYASNGDPGDPGCAEEITINEISHCEIDFNEFFEDVFWEIEILISQQLADSYDGY